jgi:type I restriction enzyme S subunit
MIELPNGWQVLTLGDVANWTSGGTPSSKNTEFYSGDIPWVCIGDLNEGHVLTTAKMITKLGLDSSSAKIMPKGTVMLAMYATSIGDTGIMETDMATNQAIACGIPHAETIVGKYLLYYLQSQKHEFFAAGRGGAQPNINQGIVKGWPIPIPPIEEQNKIIELLEAHLSRLDAALVDVKQAKIKAAQFRRSLLQAAFTGNLGSGGGSFKTELPGGWRLSTIGEVAEIIRGVTYSKADTLSENDKDAVPLLRATNLEVDSIDFEDMVYVPKRVVKAQQFLKLNDIFLAASSGSISVVGKSAQVVKTNGETFGAFCAVIRPKEIHPKFLSYWVQSPEIRDHWSATAKGTNINNLKPSDISETKIPVPPIDEQHKIVELLEDHLSRLDISVSMADAMKKQSIGLRRSLLQAAFTGQLTKEAASV